MPEQEELDVKETGGSSPPDETEKKTEVSSASTKDDKPLGDVVREAAAKSEEKASTSEEGEEEEAEDVEKEESDEDGTAEGEETEKPVPFHNHPRWKEVLKERDTAREEIEQLKPMAETAQILQQFCEANSLTSEDLQQALDLAALSRKDQKGFRARMHEMLEMLDVSAGERLPVDLQKKVEEGVIDAETAKELAQSRVRLKESESGGKRAVQNAEQRLRQSIAASLNNWEASQKKTDPDYDGRRTLLRDRMHSLWAESPPQNVQEAIELAERANKEIRTELKRFQPTKPKAATKTLTSQGSSTNNGEDLKLDSLTDVGKIVRAVAARHR